MNDFLSQNFWGATIGDYIAFVGIVLATILLKRPFSRFIARITSRLATRFSGGKYRTLFRSLIRKPLEWLFAVILFFYAFNFIEAPLNNIKLLHWTRKDGESMLRAADIVDHLFTFFAIVFTTLLLSRLVDFFYCAQEGRAHHRDDKERAQLLPLLKDVVKIVLWTMGFFWLLGVVFHVNIPALITGLGIGGVALALAAKESIENLLASFTILADKPFTVGDTVKLGLLEGAVERIGFRSSRLRTGDGSLLIIPNKKLVDESLENLSARASLHVRINVPVKYGLPPQDAATMIARIKVSLDTITQINGPILVTVDSFTTEAFVLAVAYELPAYLPVPEVAALRAEAALHILAAIAMNGGSPDNDVPLGLPPREEATG